MREIWPGRFRAPHRADTTAGRIPWAPPGRAGARRRCPDSLRRCLRYSQRPLSAPSDPTDRAAIGIDRRGITTIVPPAAGEPNVLGFQYVGLLPVLPSTAAGGTFDRRSSLFR
jgi:hypothetical protein